MTLATPADMRMIPSDPPIFPFWAWSALLHVGVVVLFSMIHVNHTIEQPPSVVQVTLIENSMPAPTTTPKKAEPAPTVPPQSKAQKPVSPVPEAPALLQARRPIPPAPQQTISPPQRLPPPPLRTTLAQIPTPSKRVKTIQPIDRHVLQDTHATNNLNLKNFLKMAQRTPASRTTTPQTKPQLDILASSAMLPQSLSTLPAAASASPARPTNSQTRPPHVLKAMVPGNHSISKSKVGLGRTIPPVYPRIARESGWEGTVLVRVAIQPDGSPDSVKVRKSSGHVVLDNAALEAVKKWKFFPAKDGNIPIRSVVEIPINFDLRKQG